MLIIRSEQLKVFEAAAVRRYEDEMGAHLAAVSPQLFKALGEEQMRRAIRFGIGRADSYGFTFCGPVRVYLELMLLFGSHFDSDPQYPWAAAILSDRDTETQMERAALLREMTLEYKDEVGDPANADTLRALRNILARVRQPLLISSEDFVSAMLQQIKLVHPQRAAYVGDEGLEALIHRGIDESQRSRFTTVRGMALVVMLMMALGHKCAEDPLYPWIARTMNDETITDPEARARLLLSGLDQVLTCLGDGERA